MEVMRIESKTLPKNMKVWIIIQKYCLCSIEFIRSIKTFRCVNISDTKTGVSYFNIIKNHRY